MELLIFVGIVVAVCLAVWIGDLTKKANLYEELLPKFRVLTSRCMDLEPKAAQYDELRPKLDRLDEYADRLARQTEKQAANDAAQDEKLKARKIELDQRERLLAETGERQRREISILADQKTIGFPWLAQAYADYFLLEDRQLAAHLETKDKPALKAADVLREHSRQRAESERRARILQYELRYYETLFPWLADLKDEDIDDELIRIASPSDSERAPQDAAAKWLSPQEYQKLPDREKYQLALDRYLKGKKTNWQLGRDYERYWGYKFESEGTTVRYQGILEGFDDLGRDLIAKTRDGTFVVQCKYWSKRKTIHEKHIFQLYGTLVAYRLDHPNETATGIFATSTTLSERATGFAKVLDIGHISPRTGEKIYHLPFDQQYDRTILEKAKGECYVSTVAEAERLGFRRAQRYQGLSHRDST